MFIRRLTCSLCFLGLLLMPGFLFAMTLSHNFPKLANLFFRWDISPEQVKQLAKWDILIIDMEAQRLTPDSLALLRKYNPRIKLLAYLASADIRGDSGQISNSLRQKLFYQIKPHWWLRDIKGNKIEWWPGNPLINVSAFASARDKQSWAQVLASFIKNELIDSGYWDGVFLDNVWSDVSFLQTKFSIDIDNDGQADSTQKLNQAWRQGMINLLKNTRQLLGKDKLIITNGGDAYYQYINGVLYEHFPEKGWQNTLEKYQSILKNGQLPTIGILNVNVDNTGNKTDYQKMRFGLSSALLADGYYSFDNGDQTHHEIWWYDEYDVYLGEPAGPAKGINGEKDFQKGVWRRDFKNGLVLVNSSPYWTTIDLGGEYEKIHGTQVPAVNNGLFVEKVKLAPQDGLILLRPIEKLNNAVFTNGSFARIFNNLGKNIRTGFFTYQSDFRGGTQVMLLNQRGVQKTIIADKNKILIFGPHGIKQTEFYPYTKKYQGKINFAVADLDNNKTLEIVTGTGLGGGPHIRIFDINGRLINPGFFAYAKNFRGGVKISLGDVNADGYKEIIVGAGTGGGPHIRIFNVNGQLIDPGFFAYPKNWRTGVNVAVGDVNGDGYAEIITGPGLGGWPEVKIFNNQHKLLKSFFAFSDYLRDGVKVIAQDLDGDEKDEIIATTTNVFTLAGL